MMEEQPQYTVIEKIGQGAYGAVYKAIWHEDKRIIAVKVSKFEDTQEGVPSTCLRQLGILKNVSHPNLIKMFKARIFRGSNPRLEMYFEYMDYDLNKYLRNPKVKDSKGLSEPQSKKIMKSILEGVRYLHQKSILHRDLKPHNILISKERQVKIADFGLGRLICYPPDTMSKEIETLWYRAPQLLLGTKKYGVGVDIWSLGCIFFQLSEGKALFMSDCEIGQLFEIFRILGSPKRNDWPQITELPQFKRTFPRFEPNLPQFKNLSAKGQQYLWKFLRCNPKQRIGIIEALQDPYMSNE